MYEEYPTDNIRDAINSLSVKVNTMNKYLHDLNINILNLAHSVEYIKSGSAPNWDNETEDYIAQENENDYEASPRCFPVNEDNKIKWVREKE